MKAETTAAIELREARADDADRASEIARRAKASWDYPADWIESWNAALTLTAEQLAIPGAFVAVVDGEIAGVGVLDIDGNSALIEHLWIAPEHHGRGAGRALLQRMLQMAAQHHVERVEVEADPYAEPFYLRHGARRTGAIPAPMPGAPGRVLPVLQFDVARPRHLAE